MTEKEKISSHNLKSDYSLKGKLRTIIIGWLIFTVIFVLTRLPAVQEPIISFADKMGVPWVSSAVNFIVNGLWVLLIPLCTGTVLTLLRKQTFDVLIIYTTGLGFFNSKTNQEDYADFDQIRLSYGKMQQSFYVKAASADIKETEYSWGEFSQPDVLQNNLQRYGKFS